MTSAGKGVQKASPDTASQKKDHAAHKHRIIEAITSLYEDEHAITRQRIQAVTGLTFHIVDAHLSGMCERGELRRLAPGVFAPVRKYPETRAISHTMLPDGTSKLEVDDHVLTLTPKERRMLGSMLMGDAVAFTNLQAAHDANLMAGELYSCMLMLRRSESLSEAVAANLGLPVDPMTQGVDERLAVVADKMLATGSLV